MPNGDSYQQFIPSYEQPRLNTESAHWRISLNECTLTLSTVVDNLSTIYLSSLFNRENNCIFVV